MKKPAKKSDGLEALGYMSAADLAKLIDVEEVTLRNWRAAKKGPAYTKVHGNRIVYPIDAVKKWLADQTVTPDATPPTLIEGQSRQRANRPAA
jgi:hypothetical protein